MSSYSLSAYCTGESDVFNQACLKDSSTGNQLSTSYFLESTDSLSILQLCFFLCSVEGRFFRFLIPNSLLMLVLPVEMNPQPRLLKAGVGPELGILALPRDGKTSVVPKVSGERRM